MIKQNYVYFILIAIGWSAAGWFANAYFKQLEYSQQLERASVELVKEAAARTK